GPGLRVTVVTQVDPVPALFGRGRHRSSSPLRSPPETGALRTLRDLIPAGLPRRPPAPVIPRSPAGDPPLPRSTCRGAACRATPCPRDRAAALPRRALTAAGHPGKPSIL